MATVTTLAKGKAVQAAIGKAFGIEPDIEYGPDYARIYYAPDKLPAVQKRIRELSKSGPGDLQLDLTMAFAPAFVEKAWPYALGLIALGYLLGR